MALFKATSIRTVQIEAFAKHISALRRERLRSTNGDLHQSFEPMISLSCQSSLIQFSAHGSTTRRLIRSLLLRCLSRLLLRLYLNFQCYIYVYHPASLFSLIVLQQHVFFLPQPLLAVTSVELRATIPKYRSPPAPHNMTSITVESWIWYSCVVLMVMTRL